MTYETTRQEAYALRTRAEAGLCFAYGPDAALNFTMDFDACAQAGHWQHAHTLCLEALKELHEFEQACGFRVKFE